VVVMCKGQHMVDIKWVALVL